MCQRVDGCKALSSAALSVNASMVISIIVAVLHYVIFRLANRFAGLYEDMDAELPFVTRFLVENPFYFWIVPLLVAAAMVAHHSGYLSRALVLTISSIGAGVSALVCAAALYLPIYRIGFVLTPP